MSKLNLNALLEMYGFRISEKPTVKLIYHANPLHGSYDLLVEYRHGRKDRYEVFQRKRARSMTYKGCSHIISFLSDGPSRALFTGIYKIDGVQYPLKPPREYAAVYPDVEWPPGQAWYDMTRLDYMDDLIERLIVNWGGNAMAWHQWLRRDNPKEIIEIRPASLTADFPGFDEVRVSYGELKEMIDNPDAYRQWRQNLKSVGGVYLILDSATGKQYIGSAYGGNGIWGRWCAYRDGHGGNTKLKEVKNPSSLQFSILWICSISTSPQDVIGHETLFKEKLGSRAHGLNAN